MYLKNESVGECISEMDYKTESQYNQLKAISFFFTTDELYTFMLLADLSSLIFLFGILDGRE